MTRRTANYGWQPDLPDQRDYKFKAAPAITRQLPKSVDMRKKFPPPYDQGELGSCTANAIGAAYQYNQIKQKLPNFIPSRLFIYYNERVMENSVNEDAGAQIRDGIKSINKQGVCPEPMWPYEINNFTEMPTAKVYTEALKHLAISYQSLPRDLTQMKGCLALRYPFVFGFTVYESFESEEVAHSGIVPMPGLSEGILGGHAVLAVGYNERTRRFLVRNSWGSGWGMKGYFTMPYDYLLNPQLSGDFWTLRIVE